MRQERIHGKGPTRPTQTTDSDHRDPIAANLLDRDFTAAAPNQRWVGDTTEFVIGAGAKLYLAAILDLYSRFVVGGPSAPSMIAGSPSRRWRWRCTGAARSRACCTTQIGAAPTRARITNGIWWHAALRAA